MNGKLSRTLVVLLATITIALTGGCENLPGGSDNKPVGGVDPNATIPAGCVGMTQQQCLDWAKSQANATIPAACAGKTVKQCEDMVRSGGGNQPGTPAAGVPVAPADDGGKQPATPAAPVQPTPSGGAPYDLPPQPQIGHPSLYLETGVPCPELPTGQVCTTVNSNTKRWVVEVLPGTTAIVGGFMVNNTKDGVYRAFAGPTKVDVTVTDGFIGIIKNDWAYSEWCFRLLQTRTEPAKIGKPDWARAHRQPLTDWTQCANVPFDTTKSGMFK